MRDFMNKLIDGANEAFYAVYASASGLFLGGTLYMLSQEEYYPALVFGFFSTSFFALTYSKIIKDNNIKEISELLPETIKLINFINESPKDLDKRV